MWMSSVLRPSPGAVMNILNQNNITIIYHYMDLGPINWVYGIDSAFLWR